MSSKKSKNFNAVYLNDDPENPLFGKLEINEFNIKFTQDNITWRWLFNEINDFGVKNKIFYIQMKNEMTSSKEIHYFHCCKAKKMIPLLKENFESFKVRRRIEAIYENINKFYE